MEGASAPSSFSTSKPPQHCHPEAKPKDLRLHFLSSVSAKAVGRSIPQTKLRSRSLPCTALLLPQSYSHSSLSPRPPKQPKTQPNPLPTRQNPLLRLSNRHRPLRERAARQGIGYPRPIGRPATEPAGAERLRGMIFYQKEKFDERPRHFQRPASRIPNDRESVEMHGVILYRQGHQADAIPFLEKAHTALCAPTSILNMCLDFVMRTSGATTMRATFLPHNTDSLLTPPRHICWQRASFSVANSLRKPLFKRTKHLK